MSEPRELTPLQVDQAALQRWTASIPEGKRGAWVLAYDKKGLVPWVRMSVAAKVVDGERVNWTVGGSIEARAKERPSTQIYSMVTW